jgi:hypothetical protein
MAPPAANLVILILSIFCVIALIGWFFQQSIHKFIQALLAYRRPEAQPQSSLQDAGGAESL